MRPVQARVRGSVSSRSSMSTTPSLATSAGPTSHQSRSSRQGKTSADLPSLDFLENEVGLWDAFFSNTRSGSRHGSVLQPDPLPFENYLHGAVARGEGRPHIQVFFRNILVNFDIFLTTGPLLSPPAPALSTEAPYCSSRRPSCLKSGKAEGGASSLSA